MFPRLPDVECLVVPWSVFAIGSALTHLQFFWECATPPHVHPTSRYLTACDLFYQDFPHVSTASDQHWDKEAWVCMRLRNAYSNHLFNMNNTVGSEEFILHVYRLSSHTLCALFGTPQNNTYRPLVYRHKYGGW